MRVGYSSIRAVFRFSSKRILMIAGLLILPITARLERSALAEPIPSKVPQQPTEPGVLSRKPDPRATRLQRFFSGLHCPVLDMAEDFVRAADENRLDWRLLPSISVVESGGGKAYRNNNIFGWDNGNQPFSTIRDGLNTVAFKLGRSPLYRNRDLIGKLRTYNPDETYVEKVISVMNRISPRAELAPTAGRSRNGYAYAAD